MKKFVKFCAALLALSAFTFGFVSCSDDDDDDSPSVYLPSGFSGKTIRAHYAATETKSGTEDGISYTVTNTMHIYLFDSEYVVTEVGSGTASNGESDSWADPIEKGTYTLSDGGTYDNATVTVHSTHEWNDDDSEWEEFEETYTITITNGKFTNEDGLEFTKQ